MPSKQQQQQDVETPKVIVIGAGISGLACARELQHRKFDVLVAEARSRPGGRLKGESIGNVHVDVGGALIHGITNNPIYQVVDQMGISTVAVQDTILLDGNGTPVEEQVDEQVSTLFNQCLDETFRKISSQPQQDSFGALFDTTIPPEYTNDLLFQWHQSNLELSCGASFPHLGYDWNDDEPYEYTGAHVALPESWNAVTSTLADNLNILYDSPVRSIRIVTPDNHKMKSTPPPRQQPPTMSPSIQQQQRKSRRLQGEEASVRRSSRSNKGIASPPLSISDATSLSYDAHVHYPRQHRASTKSRPQVQVTLLNGKVLQADAVVCTLPLGILKIPRDEPGHVDFDPLLPDDKQTAIDKLGCGLLNKCVLLFSKVFWPSDVDFVGVVDAPPQLILNAHVITGKPMLVFMFGGDLAFEVESKTDVEIVNMCMNVLRKTCKQVPEPRDYVVTRWGQDTYARGAFVYIPPRVEASKQLQVMSEPITSENGEPLVLFAGEHTTPYHPSTIHGAFSSGIREAVRLDLHFFPDWNDNLEFEADHLYKKTFTVKRKFQSKFEGSKQNCGPPPAQPVTRRRRDGVMTLRKRPAVRNAVNGTTSTSTARSPTSALEANKAPTRRSNRIAGEPVVETMPALPGKQEDRTLLRSYDSYRDWKIIGQNVFPVYGQDSKQKSEAQLRARYQQLKPKRQPRLDSAILAKWLAPNEHDE
jgi:lysine-specific histone demethylase 1